jgi:hypothetical protein
MPNTITYTGILAIEECYKCHITFAMPQDLQKRARERGETFYCPLGHSQVYSTTEVQKLQAKLEREERWRKVAETSARAARDQADAAERSARAYRGHVTRIKKRIGNGVCPCCQRHFTNVERHMASQHPEFQDGTGA